MEPITNETTYAPRAERELTTKPKRKRFWRFFGLIILVILIGGGSFIYGTDQGLQLRRMFLGTVLSNYHPQYEKFLELLLPKSEIDKMLQERNHPDVVQSDIKKKDQVLAKDVSAESEKVTVDTIETPNFTAKVMTIPDPKTVHVVATKFTTKGQPLSDLIKESNGVAGINAGGFYDPSGNGSGGQMVGTVISNGNVLSVPGNRNVPALVGAFLKDGQFITGNYSVNQLEGLGVRDAVSFGPQLIVNGVNRITPAIDGAWGWAPRTALGQKADGTVIMIITDGRFYWNKTHRGASMSDMAKLFEKYNVVTAIAMDGGGSTTMIKDGQLQLQPATNTDVGMRYLPNAWVVIPK
jgi:exopolysaccharide biosynthesis protein